jgi:hypothetical protein
VKRNVLILAVACALFVGGCSTTVVRNAANTECGRRVHSDRARCLRNIKSSDAALAARNGAVRDSKKSWAAQTLKRLGAKAGE